MLDCSGVELFYTQRLDVILHERPGAFDRFTMSPLITSNEPLNNPSKKIKANDFKTHHESPLNFNDFSLLQCPKRIPRVAQILLLVAFWNNAFMVVDINKLSLFYAKHVSMTVITWPRASAIHRK